MLVTISKPHSHFQTLAYHSKILCIKSAKRDCLNPTCILIACYYFQGILIIGWSQLNNISYKSNRYVGIVWGCRKKTPQTPKGAFITR
jgi:hypothetical protein